MTRTYWLSCAFAIALAARAQNMAGQIEPNAGSRETWVLKSGNELRLAPPVTTGWGFVVGIEDRDRIGAGRAPPPAAARHARGAQHPLTAAKATKIHAHQRKTPR
jgi:hypothetical protein